MGLEENNEKCLLVASQVAAPRAYSARVPYAVSRIVLEYTGHPYQIIIHPFTIIPSLIRLWLC